MILHLEGNAVSLVWDLNYIFKLHCYLGFKRWKRREEGARNLPFVVVVIPMQLHITLIFRKSQH